MNDASVMCMKIADINFGFFLDVDKILKDKVYRYNRYSCMLDC